MAAKKMTAEHKAALAKGRESPWGTWRLWGAPTAFRGRYQRDARPMRGPSGSNASQAPAMGA
jgi:hypothetical protein